MSFAPLVPKPKSPEAGRRKPEQPNSRTFLHSDTPAAGAGDPVGFARGTWSSDLSSPEILPKLAVGDVNDPLEREADAIADRVMRIPEAPAGSLPEAEAKLDGDIDDELSVAPTVGGFAGGAALPGGSGFVAQRKCAACETKEEEDVVRRSVHHPVGSARRESALVRERLDGFGPPLGHDPSWHRIFKRDNEIKREPASIGDQMLNNQKRLEAWVGLGTRLTHRSHQTCADESPLRRACAACDVEGDDEIHREPGAGRNGGETGGLFAEQLRGRVRGGGRPLSNNARDFLEPRLGVGLGHLRVHDDPAADSLAQRINARAFTLGNDIFFRSGELRLGTNPGKRLLAHEVAHTLQYNGADLGKVARAPESTIRRAPNDSSDPYIEQVEVLCARRLIRLYTSTDRVEYKLDGPCTAPAGVFEATVNIDGRSFHLQNVEPVAGEFEEVAKPDAKQFTFRYELRPGRPDPSALFTDGQKVVVDVDPYEQSIAGLLAMDNWEAAKAISENYDVDELEEIYNTLEVRIDAKAKNSGLGQHLRLRKRIGRQLAVAKAQRLRIEAGFAAEGDASIRAEDSPEIFQELVALQHLWGPFAEHAIGTLEAAVAGELPGLRKSQKTLSGNLRKMHSSGDFDATLQSRWLDLADKQLRKIGELVDLAGDIHKIDPLDDVNLARIENDRAELRRRIDRLRGTGFLTTGRRIAAAEDAEKQRLEQIARTKDVLVAYAGKWDPNDRDRLEGEITKILNADLLAANLPPVSGEIIAAALTELREEDPKAYHGALFGGYTITALQSKGIPGLSGFDSEDQDFLMGVMIASNEFELENPGKPSRFEPWQWPDVMVGFGGGVVDGLLHGYQVALKFVFHDIFQKEFWQTIHKLLKEQVPKFVNDRSYRREIGMLIGELATKEIEAFKALPPKLYGTKIGNLFGRLVFEIIIAVLTGGAAEAVFATASSTKHLRKLHALVRLARKSGRSALIRGAASVLLKMKEAAGKVVEASARVSKRVRSRLPTLTSTGDFKKELALMTIRERRLAVAWKEMNDATRAVEEVAGVIKPDDPNGIDKLQTVMARAAEARRKLDVEIAAQDSIARYTLSRDANRYGSSDFGDPMSESELLLDEATNPDSALLDEVVAQQGPNSVLVDALHESRKGVRTTELPAVDRMVRLQIDPGKVDHEFLDWLDGLEEITITRLEQPGNRSLVEKLIKTKPSVRHILTKCASDCLPPWLQAEGFEEFVSRVEKLEATASASTKEYMRTIFHAISKDEQALAEGALEALEFGAKRKKLNKTAEELAASLTGAPRKKTVPARQTDSVEDAAPGIRATPQSQVDAAIESGLLKKGSLQTDLLRIIEATHADGKPPSSLEQGVALLEKALEKHGQGWLLIMGDNAHRLPNGMRCDQIDGGWTVVLDSGEVQIYHKSQELLLELAGR